MRVVDQLAVERGERAPTIFRRRELGHDLPRPLDLFRRHIEYFIDRPDLVRVQGILPVEPQTPSLTGFPAQQDGIPQIEAGRIDGVDSGRARSQNYLLQG